MKTVSIHNLENLIMDQSDAFSTESTNAEHLKLLKKALHGVIQNELTEKQRKILIMYYVDQQTMPQIAQTLHINKSSVSRSIKSSIFKLYRYLRYYNLR